MHLDVRIPMGILFTLLGIVLVGYGLLSGPDIYAEHSLGHNVNLAWGVVFLLFGALMLALSQLRRFRRRPSDTEEGR